jgi:uncharacterized protein YecT (DUF1311 family)
VSRIADGGLLRIGRAMIARLLTIFAILTAAAFAQPDKKPTLVEAKAAFAKADRELNAVWEQLKKEMSEPRMAELRAKQRDWVEYRDHLASSPGYSGAPDDEAAAKNSPEFFDTAAALTSDRTGWLRGFLSKALDESMTGTWTDSYGGHVDVVEKDGKLHFVFNCVRGHSAHLGALAGIAQWNETIGWFSDKGRDKDKTDETNLAFVMDGGILEVHGANTQPYHGARAYFDGDYIKTGALPAKAQAAVLKAAESGDPMMEGD